MIFVKWGESAVSLHHLHLIWWPLAIFIVKFGLSTLMFHVLVVFLSISPAGFLWDDHRCPCFRMKSMLQTNPHLFKILKPVSFNPFKYAVRPRRARTIIFVVLTISSNNLVTIWILIHFISNMITKSWIHFLDLACWGLISVLGIYIYRLASSCNQTLELGSIWCVEV